MILLLYSSYFVSLGGPRHFGHGCICTRKNAGNLSTTRENIEAHSLSISAIHSRSLLETLSNICAKTYAIQMTAAKLMEKQPYHFIL
jgi:hypothetical protein